MVVRDDKQEKIENASSAKQISKMTLAVIWLFLLLSLLAAVIKVIVGFDIDEGYGISMPYRLLQGDHLFSDMWEVHQTSSFLPAIFLVLYQAVFHTMEGVAIYFRLVATLIHFLFSILVYKTVRRVLAECEPGFLLAALCGLIYYNFLPKWIISLDFSMQQLWGMTAVIYFLLKEMDTRKKWYVFLEGVALAMTVLAYPGMLLLYVFLLVWYLVSDKGVEIKTRFNKCAVLTGGAALMAVLFFGYVLSYMSVSSLIESIPKVFMDGTHQFTASMKFALYGKQWANVLKQMLIFGAPVALLLLGMLCVKKFLPSSKLSSFINSLLGSSEGTDALAKKQAWLILFTLLVCVETSMLMIVGNLVGIAMGPFHFQVRYLLLFILQVICLCRYVRKGADEMKRNDSEKQGIVDDFLGIKKIFVIQLLLLVSFAGILLFSNVGPDSSSSYLSIGILAGFLTLYIVANKNSKLQSDLVLVTMGIFLLSLLFCKGYYVRITEYGPSNILQPREKIEAGPLLGLYLLPEDATRVTSDTACIEEITSQGETLLFLGTEGILNLSGKGRFVSPSTISTPAFNMQWVDYFMLHPEHMPDVIVIAKNTVDNREKFFDKNPFGKWIAQNYTVRNMEETDYLCIIRK